MYLDIDFVALYTCDRSTKFDPFFVGVPTQIKIICESSIAFLRSSVKISLFALRLFLIRSYKPGSYIGEIAFLSLFIFDLSLSTQ